MDHGPQHTHNQARTTEGHKLPGHKARYHQQLTQDLTHRVVNAACRDSRRSEHSRMSDLDAALLIHRGARVSLCVTATPTANLSSA